MTNSPEWLIISWTVLSDSNQSSSSCVGGVNGGRITSAATVVGCELHTLVFQPRLRTITFITAAVTGAASEPSTGCFCLLLLINQLRWPFCSFSSSQGQIQQQESAKMRFFSLQYFSYLSVPSRWNFTSMNDQWIIMNIKKIVFRMQQLTKSPDLIRGAGARPIKRLRLPSQALKDLLGDTWGSWRSRVRVLLPSLRGPSWFTAPHSCPVGADVMEGVLNWGIRDRKQGTPAGRQYDLTIWLYCFIFISCFLGNKEEKPQVFTYRPQVFTLILSLLGHQSLF